MPSLIQRVATLALVSEGKLRRQLLATIKVSSDLDELEMVLEVWEDNEGKADILKTLKDPKAFRHDLLALAKDVDADTRAVERALKRLDDPKLTKVIQKLASDDDEDETDAEGTFEKGKKVPISQLPEALQDNAENPPSEVRKLKEQMEGKSAAWAVLKDASVKRATLDRNTLDKLVEMAAENAELDKSRDAKATPEVKRLADRFTRDVSKALSVYAQKHPPMQGTVADLMDAEGVYLVYMTLEGAGVGIWDGRWSKFYQDTKPLERFLDRGLNRSFEELQVAIDNAAYETAGGE